MKQVLIVEDEPAIIVALRAALETARGIRVLEARDGKTGLDIAINQQPELIILDLQLPGLSGQQLLERLRLDDWGKRAEVMVLTNDGSLPSVNHSLLADVHEYFYKSEMDLDKLSAYIKQKLRSAKTV